VLRAQPLPQQHCDVYLRRRIMRVRNKTDTSLSTRCRECTNLSCVARTCGFVDLKHFVTADHTSKLSSPPPAPVRVSILKHGGIFYYSYFKSYFTLFHYRFPLPWKYIPLSPTRHLRNTAPQWTLETQVLQQHFPLNIFRNLSNNRGLLWPGTYWTFCVLTKHS
jgi:hypothetical protein